VLLGGARGPAIVLALASVTALAVVAAGVELRDAKKKAPRELAPEPSDRRRVAWRGWLRGFLAGPLAGIAALGCGLAVAICAPGAVQSRMVIGGLMVPFLWAGRHGLDPVGRQDPARHRRPGRRLGRSPWARPS
jgi:hypothetical protein